MADITLSSGMGRHGFFSAIGHAVNDAFARYQWARFQREIAPLNGHMLADIGFDRAAVMRASTLEEFTRTRDGFVPRHFTG